MFGITRREATLILFSITVFTFFYNYAKPSPQLQAELLANVQKLKSDSASPSSGNRYSNGNIPAGKLLGVKDAFRNDGRRVREYTDELEVAIVGDWEPEHRPVYDLGVAGTTVGDNKIRWDDVYDMPATKLLAHVSGKFPYCILKCC